MIDSERLERLESRQIGSEKNITALTVSIEQIKITFDRMEGMQEKVSETLSKISESLADLRYLHKEVEELKNDNKKKEDRGTHRERNLEERVKVVEGTIRFVNLKIIGAVIVALITGVIKGF